MNTIFFTGNVGKDAEIRTVNGTDVCNFNVAVRQGGKDAGTEWYRVAVWGTRGNQLAQYITKGAKVAVAGELTIGYYNDKPQFEVRAHEVDPFCGGKRGDAGEGGYSASYNGNPATNGSGMARQRAPAFVADLDDDVPF